ncbi:hypothetical protein HX063_17485, partial [Myroides odoratimimus]|nr:hypothetical protein [Myroides odoratimimus]
MKRKLLTAAFFVGAWTAYSQVGIGTQTPNLSSQLDLVANDKGVLFPRVALRSITDKETIVNGNVNSLLVFNTSKNDNLVPGYYYWYEDKWLRIVNEKELKDLDKNTINVSLVTDAQELVLKDSDGNKVSIPLSSINIPTTITKNTDGTYKYINENGLVVTIDATENIISNIENILRDTNVLQKLITVLGDTYVGGNVYYDGENFTYIDENGNSHVINLGEIIKENETVTTFVANGDGTYTYTSEDGTSTVVDIP